MCYELGACYLEHSSWGCVLLSTLFALSNVDSLKLFTNRVLLSNPILSEFVKLTSHDEKIYPNIRWCNLFDYPHCLPGFRRPVIHSSVNAPNRFNFLLLRLKEAKVVFVGGSGGLKRLDGFWRVGGDVSELWNRVRREKVVDFLGKERGDHRGRMSRDVALADLSLILFVLTLS